MCVREAVRWRGERERKRERCDEYMSINPRVSQLLGKYFTIVSISILKLNKLIFLYMRSVWQSFGAGTQSSG